MTVREARLLGTAIARLREEEVIQHNAVTPNPGRDPGMDALRKFSDLLQALASAVELGDSVAARAAAHDLKEAYLEALRK